MYMDHKEFELAANNFLTGLGFTDNSPDFLDDMAYRLSKRGYPDLDYVVKECCFFFAERDNQDGGLRLQTDEETINDRTGNVNGKISVVDSDGYALTKIPYEIDKETGMVLTKLPRGMGFAKDVFEDLVAEIEQSHRMNQKKQHVRNQLMKDDR